MGYIGKMAVSIASIESRLRPDEEDVEVAVVIVVQQGAAVADGLKDVHRALAGDRPLIAKPRLLGDIHEDRRRCRQRQRLRGGGCLGRYRTRGGIPATPAQGYDQQEQTYLETREASRHYRAREERSTRAQK